MQTTTDRKKPTQDWHPADIVAALRKAGWSTRRLAIHHGYCPSMISKAIQRPSRRGEQLIADAIGVPPEEIWPERFAQRSQHTTRKTRDSEGRAAAA